VATTFERPVGELASRLDPSVLRGRRIYEGTRIPSPTPSIMTVPPELAATGDVLQVNFGPNHPSTHGVLRLVVDLNGEEVVGLRAVVGYLHTGFEKNMEAKTWWKAITYPERIDYVAFQYNELVFVLAIEKLLGLEVPEKATWMRMCLGELNRIHSHLIWIGTMALEIGAISMFWYAFRERDLVLDLFEMVTGVRMHTRYFQAGGLAEDIPPGFFPEARKFCEWMPKAVDDYDAMLDRNAIWLERTQGLGLLSAEDAVAMGQSGPVLRASGVDWDLRKRAPYLAYDQVDFDVPVYTAGDVYDRYRVRMDEMRQSVRIVAQCLDRLEDMEGLPWITDDRKVVLPPRTELHTSMESLIHHFKLVTEGYRVPEGEVYVVVEGPRGETGCYLVSDGGPRPWRVKFRAPSFVATATAPTLMQGALVADLIAIVGSLDTVMGEVDR
jgi:NADH-quinone oxidoreductase subunit D